MPLEPSSKPASKRCFADEPCSSCPYRKDTPLGVWSLDHYEELTKYDGDIPEQLAKGAFHGFGCHLDNGDLCRGWLDTHGADNLLTIRLRGLPEYPGPPKVPVYESGQAVLDANLPHMDNPGEEAQALMQKLLKIPGKKPK